MPARPSGHRRLNTGDGAPFAIPGLCLAARLGVAAQNRQVLDGASRADIERQLTVVKCRGGSIATLPVAGWCGSYARNNDQTGDLPIRRKGPIATKVRCGN